MSRASKRRHCAAPCNKLPEIARNVSDTHHITGAQPCRILCHITALAGGLVMLANPYPCILLTRQGARTIPGMTDARREVPHQVIRYLFLHQWSRVFLRPRPGSAGRPLAANSNSQGRWHSYYWPNQRCYHRIAARAQRNINSDQESIQCPLVSICPGSA